jgi:hypothetical protein
VKHALIGAVVAAAAGFVFRTELRGAFNKYSSRAGTDPALGAADPGAIVAREGWFVVGAAAALGGAVGYFV